VRLFISITRSFRRPSSVGTERDAFRDPEPGRGDGGG
jgi:hypothetical protein